MTEGDIYSIEGFSTGSILEKMDDIEGEIEELREGNEYSREKEFELLYAKFIQGLKLSTGIRRF